jgi:hypothetical protein
MPRRHVLTDEQLAELLALPATEALLIQHWTLSPAKCACQVNGGFSGAGSERNVGISLTEIRSWCAEN